MPLLEQKIVCEEKELCGLRKMKDSFLKDSKDIKFDLENCFIAGDSYEEFQKYTHPKLKVQFMRDIRDRRKREGY